MRKDMIQTVLYAGLLVAMLGGAPWPRPNWALVIAGLVVIAGGIAWKRREEAAEVARGDGAEGSGATTGERGSSGLLRELQASLRGLSEGAATRDLAAVAEELEKLRIAHVAPVADSQEDFVRRHGFAAWATVMAPLATAERMMYRAWSAASDGHRTETVASIESALPYVVEAAAALGAVEKA